jgi:alkylglycerol monooxygenase
VYALTDLMDGNRYAIVWEILRSGMGFTFLYIQYDWFGADTYSPLIKFFVAGYFLVSILVTGWFAFKHKRADEELPLPA